jgi:hypothetical protein
MVNRRMTRTHGCILYCRKNGATPWRAKAVSESWFAGNVCKLLALRN